MTIKMQRYCSYCLVQVPIKSREPRSKVMLAIHITLYAWHKFLVSVAVSQTLLHIPKRLPLHDLPKSGWSGADLSKVLIRNIGAAKSDLMLG